MSIVTRAEIVTYLGKGTSLSEKELGLINLLHPLVESAFKKKVRGPVEQATFTHLLPAAVYDGGATRDSFIDVVGDQVFEGGSAFSSGDVLQLPETPVRSITSVYEDRSAYGGQGANAFAAGTLLTAGTHYYLDVSQIGFSKSGRLIRIGSAWPSVARCVKVTYVAGYTRAELDGDAASTVNATNFKLACLMCMQQSFNASLGTSSGGAGGIVSESIDGYSVTYDVEQSGLKVLIPAAALAMLRDDIGYAGLLG